MPPTTIALPCCGLANRLRVVFSAVMHSPDKKPIIVWSPSPISGALYSDLFEPHPAFDVVDDRRWRSDDFDARCQEAAYCVRWRPMSNSTSSAAGQHRRLQVSARQQLKTERKTARKVAASKPLRTCASVSTQLGYGEVFAAAGLPLAPTWWKAPPSAPGPAVYRGCGVRFADAEAHPRQCAQLARTLRPQSWLRQLLARLLPADPRRVVGVHLRAPDAEMDIGGDGITNRSHASSSHFSSTASSLPQQHAPGRRLSQGSRRLERQQAAGSRRLSQGSSKCHSIHLYASLVGELLQRERRVSHVYVASGSLAHLAAFRSALRARLLQRGSSKGDVDGRADANGRADAALPTVLSLSDVLALDGAPKVKPRPAHEGPWAGGGRDTVYGVQGAVLDVWALASTSVIFGTGESTFGMLAAAMHRTPRFVLVHDTSVPGCRTWGQMFPGPNNSWPAFCAPNRGLEAPMTCACSA